MLQVTLKGDTLHFGEGFALSFQRTLRIPDDGKTYPLPPSLSTFPVSKVEDYKDRVPAQWVKDGGIFIPMYQREALWIRFTARHWKPNAVKIAVGKVNAVSGKSWTQELTRETEDYLVCPPQPWLDGLNSGDGHIRQFVAMPLGMGYTVEGQVTGKEEFGGIQIIVYEPKPGKFPDEPPKRDLSHLKRTTAAVAAPPPPSPAGSAGGTEMGLGAGGKMKQKIYPDPHGIDTWDSGNYGRIFIHIVNSMMYREITGKEPPPTPVTAPQYTANGLPWFDMYDEHMGDIAAPDTLQNVQSIKEMDAEKGFKPQQDDSSVNVPGDQVIKYDIQSDDEIKDGDW